MQVNESALAVDVVESDVGPINKAALHVALTVAAFLVEDQVKFCLSQYFTLFSIQKLRLSIVGSSVIFRFDSMTRLLIMSKGGERGMHFIAVNILKRVIYNPCDESSVVVVKSSQ